MSPGALVLENAAVAIAVLPELGGKIASLVNRATGREWLWRNPYLPYRRAAPGDSYVALHDTGGIDECFPTVAPTDSLPDHGELYSQAWTVERRTDDSLVTSVPGPRARYRFQRTLHLARAAARLDLDYRLENLSDGELPFVWCLHPLFAIEPGMRIELPDSPPLCVPDPSSRDFAPSASKTFAGPLTRGEVGLVTADGGEALRLRFDPAQTPFVGVWRNFAGWSGAGTPPYFNLALEPSIGDSDSLDEAIARGTAGLLAPRAVRSWRVAIELSPEQAAPDLA
ncbi:MAG: DUF5107 domain-containing protein [Myxococcota bacterium]